MVSLVFNANTLIIKMGFLSINEHSCKNKFSAKKFKYFVVENTVSLFFHHVEIGIEIGIGINGTGFC